jgi:hypothetical protein
MVNLPPIDGGDELVTPSNVIVGDNPKPSVDVMPIQDPNGPAAGRVAPREPKALAKAPSGRQPAPAAASGPQGRPDRQHRNIDLAQAAVERHFNRLERSLRRRRARGLGRWDREFADDLNGLSSRSWRRKARSTRSSSAASSTWAAS